MTYDNETTILREICALLSRKEHVNSFISAFGSDGSWTKFISAIAHELADKKKLKCHDEYYTIDHALYAEDDAIRQGKLEHGTSCVNGVWLKRIRVAFEHENRLDSAGGYQEIAKLILFNADCKVLMGYANKGDNYDNYAMDYQAIYEDARQSGDVRPILFVGEYPLDRKSGSVVKLDAYLITIEGLFKYDWTDGKWDAMPS